MFSEARGDSVQIAREYMDSLLVESRVVGAVKPDTTFRFLGETFSMPFMTAALSHLDLASMAEGAKQAGACVSLGMGGNEEMGKVLSTGAKVIKIIKPYADPEAIRSRIAFAEPAHHVFWSQASRQARASLEDNIVLHLGIGISRDESQIVIGSR